MLPTSTTYHDAPFVDSLYTCHCAIVMQSQEAVILAKDIGGKHLGFEGTCYIATLSNIPSVDWEVIHQPFKRAMKYIFLGENTLVRRNYCHPDWRGNSLLVAFVAVVSIPVLCMRPSAHVDNKCPIIQAGYKIAIRPWNLQTSLLSYESLLK